MDMNEMMKFQIGTAHSSASSGYDHAPLMQIYCRWVASLGLRSITKQRGILFSS